MMRAAGSASNPLQYLNTPAARVITGILALGEIFGDKLPSPVLGTVEDLLALGVGALVARKTA